MPVYFPACAGAASGLAFGKDSCKDSLLPCMFVSSVLCEFCKSSAFGMMDRCLTCVHFLESMRVMEEYDNRMMGQVDQELGRPVGAPSPSVKPVDYAFRDRLRLNHQILDSPYWYLPVDNKGHEEFSPVGRGAVGSDYCGRFRGLSTCKDFDAHKGVVVRGVDYTDMRAVLMHHFWCTNPSCPICFIRGWSVRGSRRIEGRLDGAVKRGFGKVEHMTVSPPRDDWDRYPEWFLREKCLKALFVREVVGGCRIFHGFRINWLDSVLRWGLHYHVLGFIKGGYDRCRDCSVGVPSVENCGGCDGFEARTRKYNLSDGCIVKVFGERQSVGATAFYQLHHATIRVGMRRFHTVTWVGNCGTRKFKGEPLKAKTVCYVCGGEAKHSVWIGKTPLAKNIADPAYRAKFGRADFGEDGSPNFVDVDGKRL